MTSYYVLMLGNRPRCDYDDEHTERCELRAVSDDRELCLWQTTRK